MTFSLPKAFENLLRVMLVVMFLIGETQAKFKSAATRPTRRIQGFNKMMHLGNIMGFIGAALLITALVCGLTMDKYVMEFAIAGGSCVVLGFTIGMYGVHHYNNGQYTVAAMEWTPISYGIMFLETMTLRTTLGACHLAISACLLPFFIIWWFRLSVSYRSAVPFAFGIFGLFQVVPLAVSFTTYHRAKKCGGTGNPFTNYVPALRKAMVPHLGKKFQDIKNDRYYYLQHCLKELTTKSSTKRKKMGSTFFGPFMRMLFCSLFLVSSIAGIYLGVRFGASAVTIVSAFCLVASVALSSWLPMNYIKRFGKDWRPDTKVEKGQDNTDLRCYMMSSRAKKNDAWNRQRSFEPQFEQVAGSCKPFVNPEAEEQRLFDNEEEDTFVSNTSVIETSSEEKETLPELPADVSSEISGSSSEPENSEASVTVSLTESLTGGSHLRRRLAVLDHLVELTQA